jgi:hypothetical protein
MPLSLSSSLEWSVFAADVAVHQPLAEAILPVYLSTCRWFAGKARLLSGVWVAAVLNVPAPRPYYLLLLDVAYADGDPERYQLPLAFVTDPAANDVPEKGVLAPATFGSEAGTLVDALYVAGFREALFTYLAGNETVAQPGGAMQFQRGKGLNDGPPGDALTSRVLQLLCLGTFRPGSYSS